MKIPSLWAVSDASLLKSVLRLSDYVSAAKERGYETIGLMEENVLSSSLQLQLLAEKAKLKPIFGLSLSYFDEAEDEFSLQLIAKTFSGYQELMRLSSYRMTHSNAQLSEFFPLSDSIAIIFTEQCEWAKKVANSDFNAHEWLRAFDSVSEKFVGIGFHQSEKWNRFARSQVLFPLFFLNEVRYLNPEDASTYCVARAIGEGERLQFSEIEKRGKKYLPLERELFQQAVEAGLEEAIQTAQQFVQTIDVQLPTDQHLLPKFPLEEGITAQEFLRKISFQGLSKRVPSFSEVYQQRLEMELAVISQMGFDDYFLIIWDVLKYAREQGMFTGFGRGSAAGSLVAYSLEITGIDPIQTQLLFERFLNPERYTLPDIDIDIPDNKREQILLYVAEKYGVNHVAQIATFGTLGAKQALRDVGRVLGVSVSEASRWSKAVPNELNISLDEAFAKSKNLRELVSATPRNQTLFSLAKKLEGLPRHVSTHAAGVVISDQELVQLTPLQSGGNGIFLTQFTMYDVEKLGLLKMDFLGLRNLTIIANTLNEVKRKWGVEFLLTSKELQDEETLRLFRRGETSGVFQFESSGIRQVLRKVQPDSIEDIVAVNALYRPGPMENISEFAARKHGSVRVSYPDDSLKEILDNTYGVIVYQEQVMQVLQKMANFTLGEADVVRRAIGKKERATIERMRRNFIEGAVNNGYSEQVAVTVYELIEKFANYGFNRSHAFAYSFVGFEMAYLKVHFPGAFYVSLLHSVRGNFKKMKEYLAEAKRRGIHVFPPDINASEYSFRLVNQTSIRFGFSAIKGVRRELIQEILQERKENGAFTSVDQFLLRISSKWLKVEWLEALVFTGVFDSLEGNRRLLWLSLEGKLQNILLSGGSFDLLEGVMKLKEVEIADDSLEERLAQEERFLGTYLSGHPLEQFSSLSETFGISSIADLEAGQSVRLFVMVREFRVIQTKKRESMAFVEVSDLTGEISLTLFPKIYRRYVKELVAGKKLLVEGKVDRSSYNQALQLIVQQLTDLETIEVQQSVFLQLTAQTESESVMKQLQQILLAHAGETSVILFYTESGQQKRLPKSYRVTVNEALLVELKGLFGAGKVMVK